MNSIELCKIRLLQCGNASSIFFNIRLYLRSEKIAELQAKLITLQQQQKQQRAPSLTTTPPAPTGPPPTTVHVAPLVTPEISEAAISVVLPVAIPVAGPVAAPHVRCSVRDDFGRWVQMCGLNQWIQMELWEAHPDQQTWGRIPLLGMTPPMPQLDNSTHGEDCDRTLYHGTCFSQLPNILSAGVLLRSAVSTRGRHAVWAAESKTKALEYSPPVKLNQVAIQCILMLDVRKAKASHFKKTPDNQQFMLREAWRGISYIYVCKASRTCPLRLAKPLGMFRPKFHWEPGFSHWNALPAQWQVNANTGCPALALTQDIPDIPRPSRVHI